MGFGSIGSEFHLFSICSTIPMWICLQHESVTNSHCIYLQKSKRKVQRVPQSQTAVLPRPQEEEETDKSKQAQTEQTYEKH